MSETLLFCLVFLSQVLLISWFFAGRLANRMRYVLERCPPSTHPKLYALPLEWHKRRLQTFTRLNKAILVFGLTIVVALILATMSGGWDGAIVTPWSASGEWDAAIVVPFFMLQVAPMLYVGVSASKHNKAMAQMGAPPVRTAELRRRQLSDFASPAMLLAAALAYVAFIAFVLYYRRFEFPWFTAAGNIAGVTFINVVMLASIAGVLHGRRWDHYQAHQDRLAAARLVVKGAVLASIAYPVLIATLLTLKAVFGPDTLEPVVASLYCQFAALVMWPSYNPQVDKMQFDVYRGNAQPT